MTYSEQWWDDMPEVAHKFATKIGYNKEKWDSDSTIPYDTKTFFQCTNEEKQAAMFLGLSPIDKKLNVWWSDLDQATKDQAIALGWSEEKWDDDWEIYHLDIDKKYWDELDKAQQKAANHFGYTKATWDETYAEEDMKSVRSNLDARDFIQGIILTSHSFGIISFRKILVDKNVHPTEKESGEDAGATNRIQKYLESNRRR